MLNFVAWAFRGWMNVLLWLILIGFAIVGAVAGGTESGGYAVLGFFVGGIVGLIIVILFGGLIANFLNMVDNIWAIGNSLSIRGNTSGGNLSGANLSSVPPVGTSVVNSGETWTCKKCNTKNNITASFCKDCGAPK